MVFSIIKPFILITFWAAILAVTLYPLHEKTDNTP